MKMKKYKHKHIQNYIVVGDISGQIIFLEIPKLFSKIVSNEKNHYEKF